MSTLSIGRLAKSTGVGVETIRFYEREGLLEAPARTASGYRQYTPDAVSRLGFIRRAKQLGFSLGEIRELLSLAGAEGDRAQVKALTEHKLAEIERRIEELHRMRAALAELNRQCSGRGPVAGCPIIEALDEQDPAGGSGHE
ncbi:MAG: MerR family DNA-binding protein [Halofilum sp. (in: g-proteobacteria)]|nr:MerR family DNA-binding protein [Halofilum sp. (in: g-proteobacteria)]